MNGGVIYCKECKANRMSRGVCADCSKNLCPKHTSCWELETGERIKLCKTCAIKRIME